MRKRLDLFLGYYKMIDTDIAVGYRHSNKSWGYSSITKMPYTIYSVWLALNESRKGGQSSLESLARKYNLKKI